MTRDDLKAMLANTAQLVRDNQDLFTPDTIKSLQQLLDLAEKLKPLLATLTGWPQTKVDGLFDSFERMLAMEKKLVTTDLSEKLIRMLTGLQNRPIILWTIAHIL